MTQVPDNSKDIEPWLKLIRADEVGPVTFARLLKRFGSVDAALGASVSGLTKVEGIGFKTADKIVVLRDGRVLCTYGYRRAPMGIRAWYPSRFAASPTQQAGWLHSLSALD